jgi:hypothetical protein
MLTSLVVSPPTRRPAANYAPDPEILRPLTAAELTARILAAYDETGDMDWSLVRPDLEIHDHELIDSAVNRGREGWERWVSDWGQSWEEYTIERLAQTEIDDERVITVHRLWARGRVSGVELERMDAQLWTFRDELLVRMDYYPNYDPEERSWSRTGGESRSVV